MAKDFLQGYTRVETVAMDVLHTFYLYLAAVLANWWAFMMAGPFIVDDTFKWICPKGKAWLKNNYQRRRKIEVVLMIFGVFLAGFLAFKDEHAERIMAETAGSQTATKLQARLDDRERRQRVKIALGAFLEEGRQLAARCADESQPPPSADADAWAGKTEAFIHENMDDSFIARFRDDSGLPMTSTTIQSMPHKILWAGIRLRTSRLQEFLRENDN